MDYSELINSMFGYTPPSASDVEYMQEFQTVLRLAADVLNRNAPSGAAKTIALRKLHEARQAGNYAIIGGR